MLTSLPAPADDAIRVSEPAGLKTQAAADALGDSALHDDIVSGALERGQLEINCQPIVSASHIQALARWPHPACLDAARWPGSHPPRLSVNVSAIQVTSGKLVSPVREALAAAKLPAQRLVIELTESLPMARSEGVSQTLQDLRDMGVVLALDDFGTGDSSLRSRMKQPVSLVKIDPSFVKDVRGGVALIKGPVDVARRFGLDVVAEGMETALQRTRLEAPGVNCMQGHLFGRPMPDAQFVAWLGLHDGSDEPFVLRA